MTEVSCSYCVSLSSVILLVNSRCSSLMHNHHQFTSVLTSDSPVLRVEIAGLLVKDVMEPVPQADMRSGFYSLYFIVPMKDSGLRLILDLRVLNPS